MQLDDRFVFSWPTPRQQSAFVRRLWPHSMPSSFPAMASSRLRLAMASFNEAGVQRERGARYASFAHVAAGVVPPAPASIAPPPFAPRRLDRRSDAEILMTCFPVTNVPRDRPEEHEPPLDFPERVAYDVREVITHSGLRLIRRFFRRTHRMACLAKQGDEPVARRAKPSDMAIDTHRHTKELFRGVPMDFSCFPFRTLQPSRWPDRPPSGDLRTRQIRREFRSHTRPILS